MTGTQKWRDFIWGTSLTTISLAAVSLGMLLIRSHISVATTALVLVIPVIWGVVIGGFLVGLIGMTLGFLLYDFIFIPPYYTLSVGESQNWIALGVYVIVVLIVSRLVSNLKDARSYAIKRENDARKLFELSQLLIGDKELSALLTTVVESVSSIFDFDAVALLLQDTDKLQVVASAGKTMTTEELNQLIPDAGLPASLYRNAPAGQRDLLSLALNASGKPVGLLVMQGSKSQSPDVELLKTFANHAALAIDKAQLKQQALRTELLEETDKWRRALLGTVSHDLRTPLASIKAAVSDLRNEGISFEPSERQELLETIESQTDRLTRLVVNLLDMTRIEAGVLEPHRTVIEVRELIQEAIGSLGGTFPSNLALTEDIHEEILVFADHTLISQVIANLLENAARYTPEEGSITIEAQTKDSVVIISVNDNGPGVPKDQNQQVFEMFQKDSHGGRAGLGLAISKAFITAHGGTIGVTDSPSGGAKFYFTIPLISIDEVE